MWIYELELEKEKLPEKLAATSGKQEEKLKDRPFGEKAFKSKRIEA